MADNLIQEWFTHPGTLKGIQFLRQSPTQGHTNHWAHWILSAGGEGGGGSSYEVPLLVTTLFVVAISHWKGVKLGTLTLDLPKSLSRTKTKTTYLCEGEREKAEKALSFSLSFAEAFVGFNDVDFNTGVGFNTGETFLTRERLGQVHFDINNEFFDSKIEVPALILIILKSPARLIC